jgi:hypothetical protein
MKIGSNVGSIGLGLTPQSTMAACISGMGELPTLLLIQNSTSKQAITKRIYVIFSGLVRTIS